ncbi:hypothetical protein B0O80DRAFT_456233 [Mortierella sp. GBAus27b]|nr:hypothetical protein BGX31_009517 [Mortierella sp. GBA43]KAI8351305.1 hypothetical protein B0O80DRAFT_456233 [Mortierella sp. GBAus27b]
MQLHDEQSFDFEWICLVDNCGKSYSGSKQLTDHQGRIHKELKPEHRFSCGHNTCKKKFKGQREAYKHKPCIKTVPRKPMAFIEVSDLSEDPSDPEEVEEALQVPEVLEDPKVESGSKIACKEEGCTCILPSQLALDEHMYMHKNITAAPPYPCFSEGCNESFGTKPEILKHAITHFK